MHRFFAKPEQIKDGIITICGDDFKHITKVLRIREKEKIEISNGVGKEYICDIKEIKDNLILLRVLEEYTNTTEPTLDITLFQGIPKGQKMEVIIQKSVELGVTTIVPIITERTVVKLNDNSMKKKIERWQKISNEASKQSKRGIIPKIDNPLSILEIINYHKKSDLNIIAYEGEKTNNIKNVLNKYNDIKSIGIVIGPEGGFSNKEISLLKKLNLQCISLGKRILRTETAGISLISMLIYHYEFI